MLPEEMATGLARGKVEQDRQGKLLERRVVLDEPEQDRNRACTGSFLLPGLGQSTQVEQSSDDFLGGQLVQRDRTDSRRPAWSEPAR